MLVQCMLSRKDTKYIIRYDYDLGGETIEVPEGCILEFDGGSFSNGTLRCNDTQIINLLGYSIFKDVELKGTYNTYTLTMNADIASIENAGLVPATTAFRLLKTDENGTPYWGEDIGDYVISVAGSTGIVTIQQITDALTANGAKLTDTLPPVTSVAGVTGDISVSQLASAMTGEGYKLTDTIPITSVVGQTGTVTAQQVADALVALGYKLTDTITQDTDTWKPANLTQEGYVPQTIASKVLKTNASGACVWSDESVTSVAGLTGAIDVDSIKSALTTAGAKLTDTDTKVTSVDNHYTPTANAGSAISTESVTGDAYQANTEVDTVTNVTVSRDAKGHVTGISATKKKTKDTTYAVTSKTAAGLCPQLPNETGTAKFLRQDGSWATPPTGEGGSGGVTSVVGETGDVTAAQISSALTGNGAVLTDTHYSAVPVLGDSTATSNATSDTANNATYLNIVENGSKSGGVQIIGSGNTTVSAKDGVITVSSTGGSSPTYLYPMLNATSANPNVSYSIPSNPVPDIIIGRALGTGDGTENFTATLMLPAPTAEMAEKTIDIYVSPMSSSVTGTGENFVIPLQISADDTTRLVRLDTWLYDESFFALGAGTELKLVCVPSGSGGSGTWVAVERRVLAEPSSSGTSNGEDDSVPANATLLFKVGLGSDWHYDSYENTDGTDRSYGSNTWASDESVNDITNALNYFKAQGVDFVCSCGDICADFVNDFYNDTITDTASPSSGFVKLYRDILYNSTAGNIRFHTALGNHDNYVIFDVVPKNSHILANHSGWATKPTSALEPLRLIRYKPDYSSNGEEDMTFLSQGVESGKYTPEWGDETNAARTVMLQQSTGSTEEEIRNSIAAILQRQNGYSSSGSEADNLQINDRGHTNDYSKLSYYFTSSKDANTIFVILSPFYGREVTITESVGTQLLPSGYGTSSYQEDPTYDVNPQTRINPVNPLNYKYDKYAYNLRAEVIAYDVSRGNPETRYHSSTDGVYDWQFYRNADLLGLENLLETNKNNGKRVLIFTHYFFPHLAGNGNQDGYVYGNRIRPFTSKGTINETNYNSGTVTVDSVTYDYTGKGYASVGARPSPNTLCGVQAHFLQMLQEKYPNAIWFSGHSHWRWQDRSLDSTINFCDDTYEMAQPVPTNSSSDKYLRGYVRTGSSKGKGALTVHLPSISNTSTCANNAYENLHNWSQGAVLEVYDSGYAIKEISFKEAGNSYINTVVGTKWVSRT